MPGLLWACVVYVLLKVTANTYSRVHRKLCEVLQTLREASRTVRETYEGSWSVCEPSGSVHEGSWRLRKVFCALYCTLEQLTARGNVSVYIGAYSVCVGTLYIGAYSVCVGTLYIGAYSVCVGTLYIGAYSVCVSSCLGISASLFTFS